MLVHRRYCPTLIVSMYSNHGASNIFISSPSDIKWFEIIVMCNNRSNFLTGKKNAKANTGIYTNISNYNYFVHTPPLTPNSAIRDLNQRNLVL